jgi:hypothetical protein
VGISKKSTALLFIAGIILVFVIRIVQVKLTAPVFKPMPTTFSLQPPTEALKGSVKSLKGEVKKTSYKDTKSHIAKINDEISQGESITTDATSSASIVFSQAVILSLAPSSQIAFPTLLPATFLLKQNSGVVHYQVLSRKGISVRVLHALLQLSEGVTTVSFNENEVSVDTTAEHVTIGMTDTENNTHIHNLTKGETATISDEERTVTIK